MKKRELVALKVFKKGDEFNQMAKAEFELITQVTNKWCLNNGELQALPIIRAYKFVTGGKSITGAQLNSNQIAFEDNSASSH
jgi:hypothetical protein